MSRPLPCQAARRAALRKEVAARTAAQFLAAQSAVLYTEPAPLRAGQQGSVFYNPGATVLAGRSEVWIRGGFNRWSHPDGTWGPIRMEPTDDGNHLKATGEGQDSPRGGVDSRQQLLGSNRCTEMCYEGAWLWMCLVLPAWTCARLFLSVRSPRCKEEQASQAPFAYLSKTAHPPARAASRFRLLLP